MPSLYENAIEAIQVGVEDFRVDDARRAASAVRNFYAGTLLLAKEALRRAAPKADGDLIIAARVKLVPDGNGGASAEADGKNTIDLNAIGTRLKEFGVVVDLSAVTQLGRIRNDIEHAANPHAEDAVREALASVFPIISELFDAMKLPPAAELGDETWATMLDVKNMFDIQLQQCEETFRTINWGSELLEEVSRLCPSCSSRLLEMISTGKDDFQSMHLRCRKCGEDATGEEVIVHSLETRYSGELYEAAKGEGSTPLHDCPECGVTAYVTTTEHTGCVWCGLELGNCLVCEAPLTPENVGWDDNSLCSYHANVISKDD